MKRVVIFDILLILVASTCLSFAGSRIHEKPGLVKERESRASFQAEVGKTPIREARDIRRDVTDTIATVDALLSDIQSSLDFSDPVDIKRANRRNAQALKETLRELRRTLRLIIKTEESRD